MELTDKSLVPTFKSSGLTQKEFCSKHDISLVKLQYHLYRKKEKAIKANKEVSPKARPAFISFGKQERTDLNQNEETSKAITIIHGRFNPKELAAMLLELEKAC
jgi:hypothetical protein